MPKKDSTNAKRNTPGKIKSGEKKTIQTKKDADSAEKTNMDALLRLRKEIQQNRPKFQRQESWRYKRLETTWRRPKGIDSKMRLGVKGWPKIVKVGYRGPRITRGLHPSGYRDILVRSINDLEQLDPQRDAIRLAAKLGRRYRTLIVSRAEVLGLKVLNPVRVGPK